MELEEAELVELLDDVRPSELELSEDSEELDFELLD